MPVYQNEQELRWLPLNQHGVEVALAAHADPGQNHGKRIVMTRAFDIAAQFGAIPISHTLAYDLMTRYPVEFEEILKNAGSNHNWFTSTLCVYTGDGRRKLGPDKDSGRPLLEFGYPEDSVRGSLEPLIVPGNEPQTYRTYETPYIDRRNRTLKRLGLYVPPIKEFTETTADQMSSFVFVKVPERQINDLNIIEYPNYVLERDGNMTQLSIDWSKAQRIPFEVIASGTPGGCDMHHFNNSSTLPWFLEDGLAETTTHFDQPTLGIFGPAESYSSSWRRNIGGFNPNFWRVGQWGEGLIIQRPLQK
jgi:hypothetical protein